MTFAMACNRFFLGYWYIYMPSVFAGSPTVTQPPIAPGAGASILEIIRYRTAVLEWVGKLFREVTDFVSDFTDVIDESHFRSIESQSPSGQELDARNQVYALSTLIGNNTQPIIDAMLHIIEEHLVTDPPDFDVNNIVDLIVTSMEKELDETNANSIYAFRTLLKAHISAILLDSAFAILSTDTTEITTTVNAFIDRAKSTLEEEMFLVERRTLNDLALDSCLDSDVASDAIARLNAKKGRQFTEIENKAEELRFEWTMRAYDRAFERQRIRIQGLQLLPVSFPGGLFPVLGELIDKRFLNPQNFINALPNVLQTAMGGFTDLAKLIQESRLDIPQTNTRSVQAYGQLITALATSMANVAQAAGQLGTMEAS